MGDRFVPISIALLIAACHRADAGTAQQDAGAISENRVASCDRVPATGTCSEYGSAFLSTNEGFVRASCGKLGGSFVVAPCPNTSVIGTCTLSTSEARKFYSAGDKGYDATRAQTECAKTYGGTWRANGS